MLVKLILHLKKYFPVPCKCFANAHPPSPSPQNPPEAIRPIPKDTLHFSVCFLGKVFTLPLQELKNPVAFHGVETPAKVGFQKCLGV